MKFEQVVGQIELKERLRRSATEDRLSHAQLFYGVEGSGNLALALAYATYILCENRAPQDSCDTCPSCQKIKNYGHPDLHFSFPIILATKIDTSDFYMQKWVQAIIANPYLNSEDWHDAMDESGKKGIIGVHESANIFRKLSLKSFHGGYKIAIVWLPEHMNHEAANKLLKIVEEPPDRTIFLFVSQSYDSLLPTIVSRLQLVRLKPLVEEEVSMGLQTHESLPVEESNRIAVMCNGNYREALLLARSKENSSFAFNIFRDWMRLCYKRDVGGVISIVDEIAAIGREKQKSLLRYAMHVFEQCMIGNYVGVEKIKLVGAEKEFSEKFMPFINGGNIEALAQEFETAHSNLERNALPKILFLDLSFNVFRLLNQ